MFQPNFPLSLNDVSVIMLPTTATLLGLVYTGLIFWLQSGFAGLEYTASVLRPLITSNSKVLLDLLVGAAMVSLFSFFQIGLLASLAYWIFVAMFMVDVFKAAEAQGHITTIFSRKFVPSHYGPIRHFFRSIRNGGPIVWLRMALLIGLTVGYPVGIMFTAHSWLLLTASASIAFLFISTAIALLQIRSLITQSVDARAQVERQQTTANERQAWEMGEERTAWPQQQRDLERRLISDKLGQIGVMPWYRIEKLAAEDQWTSRQLSDKPVLGHEPWVQGYGNLHLDVTLPYFQTDVATRDCLFHWARVILEALAQADTAVTQYELSFWRRDSSEAQSQIHLGMIKASRSEISRIVADKLTDEDFVRKLPGRYLAPNVAEY